MCCVPAAFSYSNFLRVRTECFANLFLKKDLCLYELVKLLKGCAFYSVRDYGPQKLLQNKLSISWRQQRGNVQGSFLDHPVRAARCPVRRQGLKALPCWGCEGGCCWSFSSQWPAFILVLVPCSFCCSSSCRRLNELSGCLMLHLGPPAHLLPCGETLPGPQVSSLLAASYVAVPTLLCVERSPQKPALFDSMAAA